MGTTWILILVGIFIGMAFINFLMESFAKILLLLGLIYLLFHLGFIWGADDLNEKLHLDKFLKPEVNQQVQKTYSDFSQRREENGVIDTESVRKLIDDSLKEALTKASNKNVDKDKLIQDLSTKMKNVDAETVSKALDELKLELAKYHITPDEVKNAIQQQKE